MIPRDISDDVNPYLLVQVVSATFAGTMGLRIIGIPHLRSNSKVSQLKLEYVPK